MPRLRLGPGYRLSSLFLVLECLFVLPQTNGASVPDQYCLHERFGKSHLMPRVRSLSLSQLVGGLLAVAYDIDPDPDFQVGGLQCLEYKRGVYDGCGRGGYTSWIGVLNSQPASRNVVVKNTVVTSLGMTWAHREHTHQHKNLTFVPAGCFRISWRKTCLEGAGALVLVPFILYHPRRPGGRS